MSGGAAGDLYIVLAVKEHELFERQGDDLFCEIPITLLTRLSKLVYRTMPELCRDLSRKTVTR